MFELNSFYNLSNILTVVNAAMDPMCPRCGDNRHGRCDRVVELGLGRQKAGPSNGFLGSKCSPERTFQAVYD